MRLPVRLWAEARAEFDQGVDWYEQQRTGLGVRFATAVWDHLDLISRQPTMHAPVHGSIRRCVVRGFPYCIYYMVEAAEVVVISSFHTSRDPSVWQSRTSAN